MFRILRAEGAYAILSKIRKKLKRIFIKIVIPPISQSNIGRHKEIFLRPHDIKTAVGITPPIDVLFQVENFLAGGLENVVLDLLVTFRQEGLRVALLVLGCAGDAVKQAEELGIPVQSLSYSETGYADILHNVSPSLVFSHYSTHGAALCADAGIPLVQVIHNAYMWFDEAQKKDFIQAAQHTTLFVAVSEWVREYSIKRLGLLSEKVIVIPNGIDMKRFRHPDLPEKARQLRKELGFSGSDVLFVSIAGITRQKNPLGLVKAFHAALPHCSHARLAMLGPIYDETLYSLITQYIETHALQEKIVYLGKSNTPEMYYAMADVFIHAAFFEGGQLSLLEALSTNLTIISTDIGFCRHFRDHPGVFLSPPPVDLLTYHSTITELSIPSGWITVYADCICRAYKKKIRPDLPEILLERMGRQVSYAAYVSLIRRLITGEIPSSAEQYDVWTSYVEFDTDSSVEESVRAT
ncbi:hypothetical protein FACS1894158_13940 [Betaproteobacteria bacterium]|nr:hypothetical protein FACS1894158_13940 [Betaproteobacteria bacterium]